MFASAVKVHHIKFTFSERFDAATHTKRVLNTATYIRLLNQQCRHFTKTPILSPLLIPSLEIAL